MREGLYGLTEQSFRLQISVIRSRARERITPMMRQNNAKLDTGPTNRYVVCDFCFTVSRRHSQMSSVTSGAWPAAPLLVTIDEFRFVMHEVMVAHGIICYGQ